MPKSKNKRIASIFCLNCSQTLIIVATLRAVHIRAVEITLLARLRCVIATARDQGVSSLWTVENKHVAEESKDASESVFFFGNGTEACLRQHDFVGVPSHLFDQMCQNTFVVLLVRSWRGATGDQVRMALITRGKRMEKLVDSKNRILLYCIPGVHLKKVKPPGVPI